MSMAKPSRALIAANGFYFRRNSPIIRESLAAISSSKGGLQGDRPIVIDLGGGGFPRPPFLNPNGGKGLPIFAQFPEHRPMARLPP